MAHQAQSPFDCIFRPISQFCQLGSNLDRAKIVGVENAVQKPYLPAQLGETTDDLMGYPVGDKDCALRRAQILQNISEGLSLSAAANCAGISDDVLNARAENDPIFALQILEAQADCRRRQPRDHSAGGLTNSCEPNWGLHSASKHA